MNEPVAIVKKITIGGIDNFPIEQFVRLKEGTLLYTHPVNPYQSITNTKIEPTVVSYTHPVKEMSETRIKQIFVEQTGFYFDDNPADNLALMDFAKALLLEAQEK